MKPLTIDELKGLPNGDWVWLVNKSGKTVADYDGSMYSRKYYQSTESEYFDCGTKGTLYSFKYSDYDKTWLAYKNKEQAESKGEWVELPCKRGDPIWVVYRDFDKCGEHFMVYKAVCCGFDLSTPHIRIITNFSCYETDRFGNYTTEAQAEARLKELRGEK